MGWRQGANGETEVGMPVYNCWNLHGEALRLLDVPARSSPRVLQRQDCRCCPLQREGKGLPRGICAVQLSRSKVRAGPANQKLAEKGFRTGDCDQRRITVITRGKHLVCHEIILIGYRQVGYLSTARMTARGCFYLLY